MKYRVEKRKSYSGGFRSTDIWPWRVIYPDGTTCLCFSHRSAIEQMNDRLRALKLVHNQFLRMSREYNPLGTAEVVVRRDSQPTKAVVGGDADSV